jgi:hypothetical protein
VSEAGSAGTAAEGVCVGVGVSFAVFAAAEADFAGAADSLAFAAGAVASDAGAMLHPVKDRAPIVSVMAIFLNKRFLRA